GRHPTASGRVSRGRRPAPPACSRKSDLSGVPPVTARCTARVSVGRHPLERGFVTDEPKQPWHRSLPGMLTAATGFIAAVSGLVAGLNQLGVFHREPTPPAVVGISPTPSDNTAQDTTAAGRSPQPLPAVVEPPPGA